MLRLGARELGWGTTLEVAAELAALADGCLEQAVAVCEGELRAGFGAAHLARAGAVVRGAGDGQAGRRGAEFLLGRGPGLPLLDRRGGGGLLEPARILRPPVADGDRGARRLDRARHRLPGGPAPAPGGARRRNLQLAGRGRALLRDLRTNLGATGSPARAALRGRPRAWARSSCACTSRLSSRVPSGRRRWTRCWRCDACSGTRPAAGRRSTSSWARAESGTSSSWPSYSSSSMRASDPSCASGTPCARSTSSPWPGCSPTGSNAGWPMPTSILRRVEHRVQIEQGSQTHALPADPAELLRLARRLGYPDTTRVPGRPGSTVRPWCGRSRIRWGSRSPHPRPSCCRLLDPASSRERDRGRPARGGLPGRRQQRRRARAGAEPAAGGLADARSSLRPTPTGPWTASATWPCAGRRTPYLFAREPHPAARRWPACLAPAIACPATCSRIRSCGAPCFPIYRRPNPTRRAGATPCPPACWARTRRRPCRRCAATSPRRSCASGSTTWPATSTDRRYPRS